MTIQEVYKKYKHLDELLSDKKWLPRNSLGQILFDLWQAVKSASQVKSGELDATNRP